ncbi:hypothetical protein SPBR_09062 [Sporothrix brasiliensis 5110]|uniref:Uncharacterized protein n=1 Tax=Sporothrix brasiliensis 5110 TaxID=1398154 RepID=A0A0C2ILP4_9PEZI|nr:uncharacterized protein SPBR_09062 [Sporothrix brasiliensis 5110]KIH90006.1 hypothetical protein SPBR_09062 [Sporothrix brasiliensis 5110]
MVNTHSRKKDGDVDFTLSLRPAQEAGGADHKTPPIRPRELHKAVYVVADRLYLSHDWRGFRKLSNIVEHSDGGLDPISRAS